MGVIFFTPARSAAVITVAFFGLATFASFPAATGLRTKRTRWTAGRSPVKRPRPVINAGSSSLRMARPTQAMPEPLVWAVMGCAHFRSFPRKRESSGILGGQALVAMGPRFGGDERLRG